MYWNTEGEMVCGVMKLDYDNMRVAALFDGRRKLMNAPGLGYAVILSRLDKKGRGLEGEKAVTTMWRWLQTACPCIIMRARKMRPP